MDLTNDPDETVLLEEIAWVNVSSVPLPEGGEWMLYSQDGLEEEEVNFDPRDINRDGVVRPLDVERCEE